MINIQERILVSVKKREEGYIYNGSPKIIALVFLKVIKQ